MERLTQRLAVADKAVATFEEVMRIESPSAIERDAAIHRFKYSFEALSFEIYSRLQRHVSFFRTWLTGMQKRAKQ
jgi:hypothetical protein